MNEIAFPLSDIVHHKLPVQPVVASDITQEAPAVALEVDVAALVGVEAENNTVDA